MSKVLKCLVLADVVLRKSIERDLNTDFDRAEALKLGLTSGRTPEPRVKSVEAALKKTLTVWDIGVQLALEEFAQPWTFAAPFIWCGGGCCLSMLTGKPRAIEAGTPTYHLHVNRRLKLIDPSQVVGITDTTNIIDDHTYITAMGLLRVGMDTLLQYEAPTNSIKERLNRILKVWKRRSLHRQWRRNRKYNW